MKRYSFFVLAGLLGAALTALVFTWIGVGSIELPALLPPHSEGDAHSHSGTTHFHANFRVFLGDHFVDFGDASYMEEVQTCLIDASKQSPKNRVHLHENNGTAIHVHSPGVTW